MKLVATRDVWVSAHPDEVDTSMGKTDRLKLKANTEVALLDFDVSRLRGRRVTVADLWVHNVAESTAEEKARLGVDAGRPDCLRKIGLSTVGSPWEEGSQAGTYQPDPVGHGATYNEADYQRRAWAYPGSKLWAVVMGNGHSMQCHGERQPQPGGWWSVSVDPRLIAALVGGLSHGLLLEEESGDGAAQANNYVHSRESGEYAPYLIVTATDDNQPAPDPPSSLSIESAPDFATLTHGAARVTLITPPRAFGYLVTLNGEPVPAWRVPYAGPASAKQSFVLEDLPAGEELNVEVRAVSMSGLVSSPAAATGRAAAALAVSPPLSAGPFRASTSAPVAESGLTLWAYPEVTKVDPITGEALFEPSADLRPASAVWDGAHSLVRLAAARGEIVAFQLAVEAETPPVRVLRVTVGDLRGPQGVIPRDRVRLFRLWYVEAGAHWQEEYAIPLAGPFDLPDPRNAVPGQHVQAVYVDIAVPPAAAPGTYRGTITVTAPDRSPLSLDVELLVYPVTVPDQISFSPELNCYEPPGGEAGTPYFYAAHRLAHYHRCTINTVPYGQTGGLAAGYAPKLTGEGAQLQIADWQDFDRVMGPLLDGSAFAANPRAGVPVKTFYLPFSEHWPLSLWDYYPFHGSPKEESVMVRHMLEAPPITKAFPPAYRTGFERVVREFASHCEERGWRATDFQMYLNDKYSWGGCYWTLDEPVGRDDWQALRYWAELFKRGAQGHPRAHFVFRGDVSRPWWQYDQLGGLMGAIYYNNEVFDLPEFARVFSRRIPDPHVYGVANDVAASNHQSALWCLKAYALGLNGVLPWQSLGDADSLRKPEATALIVPGNLGGYDGPIASLRVFALRRGAQDVELLRLLARKRGYNSDQIAALISQKLPLGAEFTQRFPEEAAGLVFPEASAQAFADLKEGVLIELSR